MTTPEDLPAPTVGDATDRSSSGDELTAFWELARGQAGLGRLAAVTGLGAAATVPPPAFAFGGSPRLADELLGRVLSGRKRATSVLLAELEAAGEPMPSVGDLSIVLDGAGHPRALLRTTAVDVVRFDEVDAEHARLEGERDGSLESWRAEHEPGWRRVLEGAGRAFEVSTPVVVERFERRFPRADAPDPDLVDRTGVDPAGS